MMLCVLMMMMHNNEKIEMVWVEILDYEILFALMMIIIYSNEKLKWFG